MSIPFQPIELTCSKFKFYWSKLIVGILAFLIMLGLVALSIHIVIVTFSLYSLLLTFLSLTLLEAQVTESKERFHVAGWLIFDMLVLMGVAIVCNLIIMKDFAEFGWLTLTLLLCLKTLPNVLLKRINH